MASDAMTEKPLRFEVRYSERVKGRKVGRVKKFVIEPPKLGKMQVLSKYYLLLDIDEEALDKEPHLEAMRVCENKTDVVCLLMAVAVQNSKEELHDDEEIAQTAEFFKWHCQPSDFANVVLAILTQVDYENFVSSIRLTKMLRLNKPKI